MASMIKHQVYFDTLGKMQEDTASWRSVFAGLSVLRMVDSYAEATSSAGVANWAQIHSVRSAIENLGEGDTFRGVLAAIVDGVTKRGVIDDAVLSTLLTYGRALDYDASWGLASDVFATVARIARPEKTPRIAVEANVALGGAARRNGDWDTSGRAYSQAAYIADTLGDRQGVLTVQVGIANTYLTKGNLPQAQAILDDVAVQACEQAFPDIQAKALHSRAAIASLRGEHAEGLKVAYEALELTQNPSDRDMILQDIGAIFTSLGLNNSARDAHLILAATAQNKLARWSATLNLMELASLDGVEEAFFEYARELAPAPLSPWLRAHYLLFFGEGLRRFGKIREGEDALQEAVSYANSNQLHQLSFKAQEALSSSGDKNVAAPAAYVVGSVADIVQGICRRREVALAAV
jgi:tetratricopeptide (TPR) repeat protein